MSAAEQPGAAATSARAPTPWPASGASEIGIGVVWNTVDDVSRTVTVLGGRSRSSLARACLSARATCGGVHPEVYARDRVHCCRTRVPRLRVGDHFGHPGTANVTGPLVFASTGYVLGNPDWGLLTIDVEAESIHVIAELTLALVLFSDAARVNVAELRRDVSLPVRLLAIGLPLSIAAGGVPRQ